MAVIIIYDNLHCIDGVSRIYLVGSNHPPSFALPSSMDDCMRLVWGIFRWSTLSA